MVQEHARAFARVADEQNVIIITRPVNPDATDLIRRGAPTKQMDVKPKSSNWGPQKGYLPVQQRYSKLWKTFEGDTRAEMIDKYNERAQENLMEGIAVERHLRVQTCDAWYWVYVDSTQLIDPGDMNVNNEVVLVPVSDETRVCSWGSSFSSDMVITYCRSRKATDRLGPLMVMATPEVTESDDC